MGAGSRNCLFVNSYYAGFLREHYRSHPGLESAPYGEQLRSLRDACFGDGDFYSRNLEAAGWQADDVIVNCAPLQARWAHEHGFAGDGFSVCVEQIRSVRPDVVYIQDMNLIPRELLERVRQSCGLVAGQIATPIVKDIPFDLYDLVFTSFPHYAERFRAAGRTAYYQPLAFESQLADRFRGVPRNCGCAFVGGFSGLHVASYSMMEQLAQKTPIEFWGYGAESLPADSVIRSRHHGEAWGLDMFGLFFGSRITVNRHGEVAENYANNMRLFEATGCGALLITDYKDNLDDLFRVGKEVVAYRTPEECVDLVNYYLANPDEAAGIARAGQDRTLLDHSYSMRMAQTAEILERHLRYRREAGRYDEPDASRISWGHTPIGAGDVTGAMTEAWKDGAIPSRQRALVQSELPQMYRGKAPAPYRALAEILAPRLSSGDSLIEIGCSSGYYYEILEYLTNRRVAYTGVDYSPAFIEMARDYYPRAEFAVADGASLPFPDRSFRFAISSGVLLHVTNYRDHIAENCRVASDFAIAHRTPVCRRGPTRYLKKLAYGVETVELVFDERELLETYAAHGFREVDRIEFGADPVGDLFQVTYLFERREAV